MNKNLGNDVAHDVNPNLLNAYNNTTISNVPVIITEKLIENEGIVFKIDNSDFIIPNKSVIGEHILFISNKGRIFAYDSGGFFRASAYVTTHPIDVSFNSAVYFSSSNLEAFSFNQKIDTDKSLRLLKKINRNCFNFKKATIEKTIAEADCYHDLVKLNILMDRFEVEDFHGGGTLNINYNHVQSYNYNNAIINLVGHFVQKDEDGKETIYKEVSIFMPNEKELHNLKQFFIGRISISSIVPEGSEIIYATLSGDINSDYYDTKEIALAVKDDILFCVNLDDMKVVAEFSLNSIYYYFENNKLFIIESEEIFLVNLGNEYKNTLKLKGQLKLTKDLHRFGYTEEGQPVILHISTDGITFKQSTNRINLSLKNNQIKDIFIKEFMTESQFTKVSISTMDDLDYIFYLFGKSTNELIKETFKNSKLKLYDSYNAKQLFTSWARQVNDILSYYYFGSLFFVKKEIDVLLSKNETILGDEDKLKIANILYYEVQNHKKQLETIAIYLPKLLEANERDLMGKLGKNIDSLSFKTLQKQLLAIAGQLQRSLNDIERALAQIPYAIYPDTNTRNATTSSRYRQASTMGVIGFAGTLATGAIALPFMLGSAVNAWNTFKLDKELEGIEKRKINIYVYQAIDSLEHLMKVMIPYYVDEVNQSLFYMFKQIGQTYKAFPDSDEIKKELLERISDLYTTKQLPISNSILKPKKHLIEQIHASINVDIGLVNNNLLKGGVDNV